MRALQKAIAACGSQAELARRIGKKQAHVWNWLNRDQSVPAEVVLSIERATDGAVTRHELRPDIYGPRPGVDPTTPAVNGAAA